MPINPEKTIRKNVAMPLDLWEKVKAWRRKNGISTESKAIRNLIEVALGVQAKPERKR